MISSKFGLILLLSHVHMKIILADFWSELLLPEEHIPYYFYNNRGVRDKCISDDSCPYKQYTTVTKCWGYENGCKEEDRMYQPECPGDSRGWTHSKDEQLKMFWKQGDFGFVHEGLGEMKTYCEPKEPGDSSLRCTKNLRYCKAKNLYLDFTNLNANKYHSNIMDRFREDIFKEGEVGGHCHLHKSQLKAQGEHKSALQSWYAELNAYTELNFKPLASKSKMCDVTFKRPTILMKLDAGVNMFHRFCDFVNLYLSQHMNNSFSKDVQIIMWDTSDMDYGDFFHETWKVFSKYPVIHMRDFDGKKVCLKDALFPYLPRMRFGMYYNMPLVPGCQNSSFFRAFSAHVLLRMNITQTGPLEKKLRVTLLSRSTQYRRILNEAEIIKALKSVGDYELTVVDFNHKYPFPKQLQVTHNTDIFMGMHGAGLSHLMFIPDWASVFEIYNCDDTDCYKDLARLRGVHYFTWEKSDKVTQEDEGHHPQLGADKKFTNYSFNKKEFLRLVAQAAKKVRSNPYYQRAWQEKFGSKQHQEQRFQDEL